MEIRARFSCIAGNRMKEIADHGWKTRRLRERSAEPALPLPDWLTIPSAANGGRPMFAQSSRTVMIGALLS